MTTSLIIAMISFSLTMSITPGPINIVATSSGMNYGSRNTIPFISGAAIGFTTLLTCVGFGLIKILAQYPVILKYLTVLGMTFIFYLAYKVASSTGTVSIPEKNQKNTHVCRGFYIAMVKP